jgi:hypothetical protein
MLILKKHGFFVGLDQHGRRGMHKDTQSKGGASSKTSSSVQSYETEVSPRPPRVLD